MAKDGFRVIDSDMHVMEPVDLWERYVDPSFKHLVPRGTNRSVTDLGLVRQDGSPWVQAQPTVIGDRGRPPRRDAIMTEIYAPYAQRGWSSPAQLDAMDVEGMEVAVLYPTRGLLALAEPELAPDLAAAIARAYNNWLHEFCQADPQRLLAAAMVSVFDVQDAVAEVKRCIGQLGFKAVFLRPNIVRGRNWHDPYYDPLWSTLEELGVPVGFHEGILTGLPQVGSIFGTNFMLRHTFSHSGEQMLATASFCGGGTLERHPKLRVAFLEGNCSWLPFLLWRLDEHYEWQGDIYAADLKMAPSEYFKRQCYASAEPDEEPVKYVIDWLGNQRLVFSTDFPHTDAKFPRAVERFLQLPITEEDKRRILWDNCAYIYGVAETARR